MSPAGSETCGSGFGGGCVGGCGSRMLGWGEGDGEGEEEEADGGGGWISDMDGGSTEQLGGDETKHRESSFGSADCNREMVLLLSTALIVRLCAHFSHPPFAVVILARDSIRLRTKTLNLTC